MRERVRRAAAQARSPIRSPPGRRIAADQRDLDGASHAPASLSALPGTDQRPAARADRRIVVWAAVAGGGRDVDRPPSCLASRDRRARARPFRRRHLDRERRRDLPARLRGARRPAGNWTVSRSTTATTCASSTMPQRVSGHRRTSGSTQSGTLPSALLLVPSDSEGRDRREQRSQIRFRKRPIPIRATPDRACITRATCARSPSC